MSKRRYKEYLREDLAVIPRTTLWRTDQSSCDEIITGIEQNNSACHESRSPSTCSENSTDEGGNSECGNLQYDFMQSDESNMDAEDSPLLDSTSEDDSTFFEEICDAGDDYDYDGDNCDSNDDGDDEDDDIRDFGINGGSEPIYSGADLTRTQSLLLLMAFVLKHQLTNQALDDFLTVLNMHLPNVVPQTKYLFYKNFTHKAFNRHYFCGNCTYYFGPDDICNTEKLCLCSEPNSVETAKKRKWYFSYWKVQSQLQLLLQDDSIADCLLNRTEQDSTTLKDATNGEMYKHLKEVHGYGPNDLSLLWNVDGVPVFKSSNRDLWPIQCTVLELPVEKRKNNIIMPALWFSECKVDIALLLQPFVEEIKHLSTEGFLFNGQRVRVFAPICTADAPARPKVKNTKQFNGMYGCDWCLHPGIQVPRGKGHARVYPFEGVQEERTHHGMEILAVKAVENNTSQFGIKGPSYLSHLNHFDLVNGFVPDFLHCALLGVARQLNSLWFESVNHDCPWYIGQPANQRKYDEMLKGIVAPKEIRRLPRSVTTREHWKANEYKTFVLYYALIILQDLLPVAFLNHYFLFVWSLHKLLGINITSAELIKVKAVLNYFILKMEELYGVSNCTFNVHQLSHLAKSTQMCGPLWAVSTFIFENNNSTLKNMIQGTQYIPDQVCHTYAIMKAMPMFMKQNVEEGDCVSEILQKLVSGKAETKKAVTLDKDLLALGKARVRRLSDEESVAVRATSAEPVNPVVYEYNRFVWKGKLYDTAGYNRSTKRQNRCIKADCQEVSAASQVVVTVPVQSILTKCIKIVCKNKVYLVDMPNMVEME